MMPQRGDTDSLPLCSVSAVGSRQATPWLFPLFSTKHSCAVRILHRVALWLRLAAPTNTTAALNLHTCRGPPAMATAGTAGTSAGRFLLTNRRAADLTPQTASPVKPEPKADLQLIDNAFQICTDEVMQVLAENSDFLVMGAVGTQGTGKSSLLNALCDCGNSGFKTQDEHSVLAGCHCSEGIGIRVHATDRTICLDSQPLFSTSALTSYSVSESAVKVNNPACAAAISAARTHGFPALSAEGLHDLLSLQMVCFLLSVCHLVVVMVDTVDDLRIWDLLQTADILIQSLPDIAATGSGGTPLPSVAPQGRCADLVFVLNNQQPGNMDTVSLQLKHDFLQGLLSTCSFASRQGSINNVLGSNARTGIGQKDTFSETSRRQQLNFYVLGRHGNQCSHVDGVPLSQRVSFTLERLAFQLLKYPRRPFTRSLTEKEWLKGCERLWDEIQQSQEITGFYLHKQQTAYAAGGGWEFAVR